MIRVAVAGLGKMGLSHYAIINALKGVNVVAVCDSSGYILDVLSKYTGVKTFTSYEKMLNEVEADAVIISTPSRFHFDMISLALEKNIHVFSEKPFTLDHNAADQLVAIAESKGLVNQVGYHNRFVGAFREVKRLLDSNAIGRVTHSLAEAYGPVVLKPKGLTWRTAKAEGGGCLYDYAAHPLNLLNWYFGPATGVGGSVLNSIFSAETDDEVYSTIHFNNAVSSQLSVNWSDDSYRKMSTKITIWGTNGRIYADRQEVQVYLRDPAAASGSYQAGWNIRYTTELTDPVEFYIRGEEYSSQMRYFADQVAAKSVENINSFRSAAQTDQLIDMIKADAENGPSLSDAGARVETRARKKGFSFFGLR